MAKVLEGAQTPPGDLRPACGKDLDAVVMKALSTDPRRRFETAREMASALQKCVPPAPQSDVGDWVNALARDALTDRRRVRKRVESRDLSKEDSSVDEFISRPSNEDLLTVIDRPRHALHEDDSTQPVTGSTSRKETSRLLLPLVLGIGTVIGTVVVLLVLNEPELDPGQAGQNVPTTTAPPRDAATPSELDQTAAQDPSGSQQTKPGDEAAESDKDGDDQQLDAESEENEEEETSNEKEATQAAPVRAPTAQPRVSKPPCPKYITDEEGIRRINRKCWK
jgi:hypothetical protein